MATRAVAVRRRPVPRAYTRAFRSRGKKKFTVSLLTIAGLAPGALNAWNAYQGGAPYGTGVKSALHSLTYDYTGYDNNARTWSLDGMKRGLLPLALGLAGHKLANKIGINRMFAQAGIPVVRL